MPAPSATQASSPVGTSHTPVTPLTALTPMSADGLDELRELHRQAVAELHMEASEVKHKPSFALYCCTSFSMLRSVLVSSFSSAPSWYHRFLMQAFNKVLPELEARYDQVKFVAGGGFGIIAKGSCLIDRTLLFDVLGHSSSRPLVMMHVFGVDMPFFDVLGLCTLRFIQDRPRLESQHLSARSALSGPGSIVSARLASVF